MKSLCVLISFPFSVRFSLSNGNSDWLWLWLALSDLTWWALAAKLTIYGCGHDNVALRCLFKDSFAVTDERKNVSPLHERKKCDSIRSMNYAVERGQHSYKRAAAKSSARCLHIMLPSLVSICLTHIFPIFSSDERSKISLDVVTLIGKLCDVFTTK